MASIFDGWTDGDLNNPFFPSGSGDWRQFYDGIGKPAAKSYIVPDNTNGPGKFPSLDSLKTFLRGNGEATPEVYADPVDQLLHDTFGFSKPTGRAETDPVTGAVTNNPWSGVLPDIAGGFVQIALIAIGAVIIFVALWMLLSSSGSKLANAIA